MPALNWTSKNEYPLSSGRLSTELVHYCSPDQRKDLSPENRLILGDNLLVMTALLDKYAEKIDLIYADPPFFTNKGYSTRVGRGEDSRKPDEWQLAEGYTDEWDNLNAYLDMLYPRLQLMHQLLAPTGSLFLHLDWHANSYARVLLDEIFGYDNLRNEIIWTYHGPSPIRSAFNRKHDTILFYSKTDQYKFDVDRVRIPYAENTVETFKSSKKAGFGKVPNLAQGKVPEDWWYFPVVARLHQERTGYPTQKPEKLLERIILSTTDPDDLVADFFAGAGTAGSVSARLGRRFIISDVQPRAFHTSRARLILDQTNPEEGQGNWNPILVQREEQAVNEPPSTLGELDLPVPEVQDSAVVLPEGLRSLILYWEIDPDWDGVVFHSRVQAARPWRKGDLPAELPLPPDNKGQVCLRGVLVSGEHFQQVLN